MTSALPVTDLNNLLIFEFMMFDSFWSSDCFICCANNETYDICVY